MTTKSELKQQIKSLTEKYLGFGIDGVYGISSMSKQELENDVKRLIRANRFKSYANKIQVDNLKGYFAKEGTIEFINFNRKSLIMRVANELWHNQPYDKAKQKARDYNK